MTFSANSIRSRGTLTRGLWLPLLCLGLFLLTASGPLAAQAVSAQISFAKPLQNGKVTFTVSANGASQKITADIKGTDGARKKREKVQDAFEAMGHKTALSTSIKHGPQLWVFDLPAGTTVSFDPSTTGEKKDVVTLYGAGTGMSTEIDFTGTYLNLGLDTGGAAEFTAGVVTPLGEALVIYRAEDWEVGELLEGEMIAQRLALDLEGAAADLGAELQLDGARILITIAGGDPDEGAGVLFGTTSPSPSPRGSVYGGEVGSEPPAGLDL